MHTEEKQYFAHIADNHIAENMNHIRYAIIAINDLIVPNKLFIHHIKYQIM